MMIRSLFDSRIPVQDRLVERRGLEASQLGARITKRPKRKYSRAGQQTVPLAAIMEERDCPFDVSVADLIKGRFNMSTSVVLSTRTEVEHVLRALRYLSAEAIRKMDGKQSFTVEVPGLEAPCRVIETDAGMIEHCYFAQSRNSSGQIHSCDGNSVYRRYYDPPTRIKMRSTNKMTIITNAREGWISIVAAHYGPASRPVPGTEDCTPQDQAWWFNDRDLSGHAFIVDERDRRAIVKESVRVVSPWSALNT